LSGAGQGSVLGQAGVQCPDVFDNVVGQITKCKLVEAQCVELL